MAKPSDFFLGVTDLFSILLPGAALTYVLDRLELHEIGLGRASDTLGLLHMTGTPQGYVAFLVFAYLAGHGVDMFGAFFLDGMYDLTYAHMKRSNLSPLRWCRRSGLRLSVEARRKVRAFVSGNRGRKLYPTDRLLERARELAQPLMPAKERVFQWCRSWVLIKSPTAFLEIERVQANSKFFRGMFTTFVLVALISAGYRFPFWLKGSLGCLVLAGASFVRYCDLRWKAVQLTYRVFIAMQVEKALQAELPEAEEAGD